MRRIDLAIDRVLARPLVDRVEKPTELQVGEGALVAQRARELCLALFADSGELADELHADVGERVEVDRAAIRRAGELERRQAAHADHVVDVGVHLVVQPGDVHPPLDVHASVHAGRPHVTAHRQGHLPA